MKAVDSDWYIKHFLTLIGISSTSWLWLVYQALPDKFFGLRCKCCLHMGPEACCSATTLVEGLLLRHNIGGRLAAPPQHWWKACCSATTLVEALATNLLRPFPPYRTFSGFCNHACMIIHCHEPQYETIMWKVWITLWRSQVCLLA